METMQKAQKAPAAPRVGDSTTGKAKSKASSSPFVFAHVNVEPVAKAADVPSEVWLWPGRIPIGHVTLLAGEPGVGKSLVGLDLAARLSRGPSWPDGLGIHLAPCRSVLLVGEDFEWTVRRRLAAQEADLERVMTLSSVEEFGRSVRLDLERHLDALIQTIKPMKDVRLIVVDPLASFTGEMDAHRPISARRIMEMLKLLAEHCAAAVVAVTHLNKSMGLIGLNRAMGSVSLSAVARSVYFVTRDPSNPDRRLMIPAKQNLVAEGRSLAYRIVNDEQGRPKIQWEPDPVPDRLEDVLRCERDKSSPACDRACDFLMEELASGPKASATLVAAGRQHGISFGTIRRAKKALGLRVVRHGFGPGATISWRLPDELIPAHAGESQPAVA